MSLVQPAVSRLSPVPTDCQNVAVSVSVSVSFFFSFFPSFSFSLNLLLFCLVSTLIRYFPFCNAAPLIAIIIRKKMIKSTPTAQSSLACLFVCFLPKPKIKEEKVEAIYIYICIYTYIYI